jgi:hypothetical protein
MEAKAQIISERLESYTGKRGRVEERIISCLDLDSATPFINTFDYVLRDDEAEKHSGKIQGKIAKLGISAFEPVFGGRLRAKGKILSVS